MERSDRAARDEWADQERAVREERVGMGTADLEPRVAQYRLITRLLREPMEEALPPGFAAMVAARSVAVNRPATDQRERWLQPAVFTGLALAAIAGFGGDLVHLLHRLMDTAEGHASAAAQWATAIGACLALTLLVEIWTTAARTRPPSSTRAR